MLIGSVSGFLVIVIAALSAVGWVVAVADSAPNLNQLAPRQPHPLSQIFASDGTPLGYINSPTVYAHASNRAIPQLLKQATVAIEDRRFWHHGALDYQGILRAGVKDLLGQSNSLQGASTLTMQLVDNTYMPRRYSADHNLKYKIIQAKLAEQLEAHHSKQWILDNYLNDVPYGTVNGETAIGVGAASRIFFDKPVSKLDLAQVALLAGLPQAPSEYNPFLYPTSARARRTEVLQAMASAHNITPAQARAAERAPLQVQPNSSYSTRQQPYVFDFVEQELIQRFGLKTVEDGGLKVYTTIDLHKQAQAQAAIDAHEGAPGDPAAALASIDPSNGNVVALANSSTYNQTTFDDATQAERQPGSAFKVFVLMTLIHDYNGDPNQTYYTSKLLPAGWLPYDPTWTVHTAEDAYQGTINVTKATTLSDNTVFAQLDVDLGPKKVAATAHAMGITTPLQGIPAEAIGGLKIGVTPLEMADAYGTLANGGSHVPFTVISKVVFPNGHVVDLSNPPHRQVFPYNQAYAATQVLKTVITSGTGTAANYGCPAAGKTGTTNSLTNAWFVGYTPKLSTAVWVGYQAGNIPMANGFGGSLAAPIWHDYMEAASGGYCGDFTAPTVPFHGTPFIGPHSATGAATTIGPNGTPTGGTGAYNNPTLFAQPPQPPPGQLGTGTGGGAGTGAGGGRGGHGGGRGAGHH